MDGSEIGNALIYTPIEAAPSTGELVLSRAGGDEFEVIKLRTNASDHWLMAP